MKRIIIVLSGVMMMFAVSCKSPDYARRSEPYRHQEIRDVSTSHAAQAPVTMT